MAVWRNSARRGAFKSIRIQILYPCNAKCSWCATRLKNPLFRELYQSGVSDAIHDYYIKVIERMRPEKVFISGGEPLLYPRIAHFLNAIQDHTQQINLFTSYQFSESLRQRIPFTQMPMEKIVLCHTMISFEPRAWADMTANFPFELYVNNIKAITRQPLRKRFKFIINHKSLEEEIALFQEQIKPDQSFEFGLKVINDQGGGINETAIQQTRRFTNKRVIDLDKILIGGHWGTKSYKVGSVEQMAPLLEDGDVTLCPYRSEPLELRFAFYRSNHKGQVLKYRYCPYFPSDFGYRFHIGRDNLDKLERNFYKGSFHNHCHKCRFLKYLPEDTAIELESDVLIS